MTKQREFTGKHFLMVFIGFFGTIFAVNFTMAYLAVSTFPGLEVKNGYIASQQFNGRRKAQEALGWTVEAEAGNGQITLSITDVEGNPVKVAALKATLGRPTQMKDDTTPDFKFDGAVYAAPVVLEAGKWNVRMIARADDGTEFTQRLIVHIKE
jgi:nitrogen fixation protein FixH